MHTHCFIESFGALVAFPDIQRHIVTTDFLCVGHNELIKRLSDVLTPCVFIYAYVVNIECLNLCKHMICGLIDNIAEGMTFHNAVIRNINKNGIVFISWLFTLRFFGFSFVYSFCRKNKCCGSEHAVTHNWRIHGQC